MIVWVARQAAAAKLVDQVCVATDDARIRDVVTNAGFDAVMTSEDCACGSDRVAEAAAQIAADLIVNVQGDEPLVDPLDIDALVETAYAHPQSITTLARHLTDQAAFESPHVVKVVAAASGRALYFSRALIPAGSAPNPSGALQHVGLYAYPPPVLRRFTSLPPSPLEGIERLEQLRALENGIPIQLTMCVSVRPSIGVDIPADLDEVRAELARRMKQDT